MIYLLTYPRRSTFSQFGSTTNCFLDPRSSKIGNALNDPKLNLNSLTVKSILYTYTKYLLWGPRLTINRLRDTTCTTRYNMYKVSKNRKCTELPQTELGHLTVKSSLYTINTYIRSPDFHPFCSTTNTRYKVAKNQKCTKWPQTELEQLTVKSTLYTRHTYPWGPNFGPFHSRISLSWDTTCTRSAKIGNALNDPKLNLIT